MSEFHFIRTKKGVKKIKLDEIMYIEANDNHVYFIKEDPKTYEIVRMTLESALEQLPPKTFARISRTFAVSLQHVIEAEKEYITFENKVILEYTHYPKYWAAFLKQLNIIETPRGVKHKTVTEEA